MTRSPINYEELLSTTRSHWGDALIVKEPLRATEEPLGGRSHSRELGGASERVYILARHVDILARHVNILARTSIYLGAPRQ